MVHTNKQDDSLVPFDNNSTFFKAVIDSLVSVQGVHLHIFDEAGVRVTDEVVINIANQNNSTNKSAHNTTLKTTRLMLFHCLQKLESDVL